MSANLIEIAAFATVFLGVWVIYEMGGGEEIPSRTKRGTIVLIEQYTPAITAMLEYRNAKGVTRHLRVKIARAFHTPDGYVYLRGYYLPSGIKPRSFRVDRIISVAALDGAITDRRLFLTGVLKIPSHHLPRAPLRSAHPMVPAA
jgi:hypothetical protein